MKHFLDFLVAVLTFNVSWDFTICPSKQFINALQFQVEKLLIQLRYVLGYANLQIPDLLLFSDQSSSVGFILSNKKEHLCVHTVDELNLLPGSSIS